MNLNEIKSKFPNASNAFIKRNIQADYSRKVAELESNLGDAPLGAEKVQGRTSERFLVRIKSVRKRLIDEDNLCEKYAVDLLRYSRVIPDDSPERTKIEVSQQKAIKNQPETIEIEVTEL